MKRFVSRFVGVALGCLLWVGCSDPSDKLHKSEATAPVQTDTASSGQRPTGTMEYVVRAADSTIGFIGSKVTGKHDGGFKNFAGNIQVADGKVVGSPEFKINMKSIWSDNEKLTGHLKSADFFDVDKYPQATFTVTKIEPAGDHSDVTGNLELHGVAKSITFPAKIEVMDGAVSVNADFAINRKDFNINYPGKTDDLIRDNVALLLNIKATPGQPSAEDSIAD